MVSFKMTASPQVAQAQRCTQEPQVSKQISAEQKTKLKIRRRHCQFPLKLGHPSLHAVANVFVVVGFGRDIAKPRAAAILLRAKLWKPLLHYTDRGHHLYPGL